MWGHRGKRPIGIACAALLFSLIPHRAAAFVTFETGQVRPLALTPDGHTLLALNTPDARLEVFSVVGGVALRSTTLTLSDR